MLLNPAPALGVSPNSNRIHKGLYPSSLAPPSSFLVPDFSLPCVLGEGGKYILFEDKLKWSKDLYLDKLHYILHILSSRVMLNVLEPGQPFPINFNILGDVIELIGDPGIWPGHFF